MRHAICILTLLFTGALIGVGQNQTTTDGLKTGKWSEIYESKKRKLTLSGIYNIIPLTNYDTIRPLGETTYEVKYKGATPLLFISGRSGINISVKDGLWQTASTGGKIYQTEYWENGLKIWTKYFDDIGQLTAYNYDDLVNDTSFYLTYINNKLYKKSFYPPGDKNQRTEVFNPENNLIIPNAEPFIYTRFGDTSATVFPLKLTCKKDLTIVSVSSNSSNIQVGFPMNKLPFKLSTKDTATFHLIFAPTPTSYQPDATVTIVTDEENVLPYRMYCSLSASHLYDSNLETLKQITLSKTKDKYLVIAPMGTVTDAIVINAKGKKKKYSIDGVTKIDLRKFKAGVYTLAIYSCHIGGQLRLTILK